MLTFKKNPALCGKALPELAMMDEQNLLFLNDEDGDGEVNFLVNVGHALL